MGTYMGLPIRINMLPFSIHTSCANGIKTIWAANMDDLFNFYDLEKSKFYLIETQKGTTNVRNWNENTLKKPHAFTNWFFIELDNLEFFWKLVTISAWLRK